MSGRITNNHYLLERIGKSQADKGKVQTRAQRPASGLEFRQVLDRAKQGTAEPVKISKHAEKRLQMRNVSISEERMREVSEAMERASEKGIKDALILVDGNALIASIQNRTIVTAAKQDGLDSKIITNIDGAIVL